MLLLPSCYFAALVSRKAAGAAAAFAPAQACRRSLNGAVPVEDDAEGRAVRVGGAAPEVGLHLARRVVDEVILGLGDAAAVPLKPAQLLQMPLHPHRREESRVVVVTAVRAVVARPQQHDLAPCEALRKHRGLVDWLRYIKEVRQNVAKSS